MPRDPNEPVRLTRIYTRGGDKGETSLGDGSRISKLDPRVAAMGDVDELNSLVGWAGGLERVQNELFDLGADLAVPFVEGDERRTTVLFQPGTYERALDAVEGLRPIAARYGKSVPQLAVQWLTSRPGVSSPLLGARTVKEIEENVGSVGWTISADDVAAIDRLTSPVWAEIADKGDMFGYWARKRQEAKAK